jgi:hypothetical protein
MRAIQLHRTAASLLFGLSVSATIVDRIAVTAGTQVITDSEIDQRIRLSAFEDDRKPDFDTAFRKKAADRLIDEKLIEHEMDVGRYPRISEERRRTLLSDYAKASFKGDVKAMDAALAARGLTRDDLEEDLARQADLLTFLSVRFRPAVQVTDDDVRQYFQQNIAPKVPKGAAALEDFRSQIETKLTNDRADVEIQAWLKEQRRRVRIQYLEKELAP